MSKVNEYILTTSNKRICDFYIKHSYLNFEQINLMCIDLFESILEDSSNNITESLGNRILSECMENKHMINTLNTDIETIKSGLSKLSIDLSSKVVELKKEYQDDIKNMLNTYINDKLTTIIDKDTTNVVNSISSVHDKLTISIHNNQEKLHSLFEKTSLNFIDKAKHIFSELLPQQQNMYDKQLKEHLNHDFDKLYTNITQDFLKIHSLEHEINNKIISLSNENHNRDKIINELTEFIKRDKEQTIHSITNNIESRFTTLFNSIQQPVISSIQHLSQETTKKQGEHDKLLLSLQEYLNKYRNSSFKGAMGEARLLLVLNQMFPTAEVIDTSSQKESGDCFLKRDSKDKILLETKQYDTNVNPDEVKKFIRDCDIQKCHGIFMSQNSGITSKHNYQVDIHNGCFLVYIHNAEYHPDKIRIAVNMIDSLVEKFKQLEDVSDHDTSQFEQISKDLLYEINVEFQRMIIHKQSLVNLVRDFEKKMVIQINEICIPSLDSYISHKYSQLNGKYTCDLCNVFTTDTVKSLSAHKRGCKKLISKQNIVESGNIIIDISTQHS